MVKWSIHLQVNLMIGYGKRFQIKLKFDTPVNFYIVLILFPRINACLNYTISPWQELHLFLLLLDSFLIFFSRRLTQVP